MLKRTVGVVAAAALAVSACGGDGSSVPTTTTTAPSRAGAFQVAFAGLCLARASARTDVNVARSTFYDRSHDALHVLAADLASVDRSLAARLLEAKEAVESDFQAEPPPPSLAPDLDRLVEVTGQALARLSLTVPRCP